MSISCVHVDFLRTAWLLDRHKSWFLVNIFRIVRFSIVGKGRFGLKSESLFLVVNEIH